MIIINKLFVGNLSFGVVNEDLGKLFSDFGEVEEAVVIIDRDTRRSKGFGFVTFKQSADALKAKEGLNGKDFQGRNLTIDEARPKV